MTMISFETATYGNKGGSHQLLRATVTEGTSALNQLRFLVDRPAGHVDSSVNWSPYWGCQPVETWWVLWRGEEDLNAPRRNMVKVEVVLLPITHCAMLQDIDGLLKAVGYAGDDRSQNDALQLTGKIIQQLSSTGSPVTISDIGLVPSLLRALWPRLWPSARAALSVRTVFAAESLNVSFPPHIVVLPAELAPRWRGHTLLERAEPVVGHASRWFAGDTSPLFQRLLDENSERLPGEFTVLARVERIFERLERLRNGKGTVSDALVVARTQEAFSAGFNLPQEDMAVVNKTLSDLLDASVGDIRTASLVNLVQITNQNELEASIAAWIQMHLPETADQDALWILQHHLSKGHAKWWRTGVSRGIAKAIKQRRPEWAKALWRWWIQEPSSVGWSAGYLLGSSMVEIWLANETPKRIHDELIKHLLHVCREHNWATMLARILGSKRPLVECLDIIRKTLRSPEDGIDALLSGRDDVEIITAAAVTNWPPLIDRVTLITQSQPGLFELIHDMPGLIPLLVAHLKGRGVFPAPLIRSDFLATIFDGILQHDQQLEYVAGFLPASAGTFAIAHPSANELLVKLNPVVISGAVTEWWSRFFAEDSVDIPPGVIRQLVIDSVQVRCNNASATLIVRLLQLIPDVSEEVFVEWMKHTRFSWDVDIHQQVASLLLERDWRMAATTFRYSWKRELKAVAWYARDLLAWSDGFLWPPAGVDSASAIVPFSSIKNPTRREMKILFLASNPISSNRLALDEEARQIEEKVHDAKHRDSVTFKTRWAVRPEDLQQALLEDRPEVVHFSGHGGGAIGIVLHSKEQKDEKFVAEKALSDLFRIFKNYIRVVVLNACYSDVQAKVIVQEIDFVIGMSDSVGDEAARVFAAAFYRGLAFGQSVQTAFELGINELRLVGLEREDHIPQLLVRSGVDPLTTVLVGKASLGGGPR